MFMTHTATLLLPAARRESIPIGLFLVCANIQDIVWFSLMALGLETIDPASLADVSLSNLSIDSPISHGPVYTPIFALVLATVAHLLYRRRDITVWAALLVFGHGALDFLCAWDHPLVGSDGVRVGLDLYHSAPRASFLLEAVINLGLVGYFIAMRSKLGRPVSARNKLLLVMFLGLGHLPFLPFADASWNQLMG